jgi:hypothetical protein
LLSLAPVVVEPDPARSPARECVLLLRFDGNRRWAAVIPERLVVLHNGQPVRAGLRLLAHRDALAMPDAAAVFFSTEEAARVDAFEGAPGASCPRCRGDLRPGELAVQCPACGVAHHESAERPCWTYAETCSLCSQPTALDSPLRWTPESL